MVEFKTQHEPQLDEPEMVDFTPQRQPQRGETAVQQTLPAATVEEKGDAMPERIRGRDEAIWLEKRPKVIEGIKSGVAALRETSAQMRANRDMRNTAKTGRLAEQGSKGE